MCSGAGCGDGDDTNACQVAPADDKADAAGTLTYSVSVTGSAQVNTIVYAGPAGEVTLDAPTLPFSLSLPVAAGASMHIEALGRAEAGGAIMASHSFLAPGQTTPVLSEAACER
jgi:hypothetical protein